MNNFFSFLNEEINYRTIAGGPRSSADKDYIIQTLKNNKIDGKVDQKLFLKVLDKGINQDWIERVIRNIATIVLHGSSTTKYADIIKGRERSYGGSAPVYKEIMEALGFENNGGARNVSWHVKKSDKLIKYPAYFKSKTDGSVVKFTDLQTGVVVDKGEGDEDVGYSSTKYRPHDDKGMWIYLPDYKESKKASAASLSHKQELIKFAVNTGDLKRSDYSSSCEMFINGESIGSFSTFGYGTVNPEVMSSILSKIIGEKNVSVLKTRIKNTRAYSILFGKVQAGNWAKPDRISNQQYNIRLALENVIEILNKDFGTNIDKEVAEDSVYFTKLSGVKTVQSVPAENPKKKELLEVVQMLEKLQKMRYDMNSYILEIRDYVSKNKLSENTDIESLVYNMKREEETRKCVDAILFYKGQANS